MRFGERANQDSFRLPIKAVEEAGEGGVAEASAGTLYQLSPPRRNPCLYRFTWTAWAM